MVSQLSISEVANLLRKEGFRESVVELVADCKIDGETLLLLDYYNLEKIGVTRVADRVKFCDLISELRKSYAAPEAQLCGQADSSVRVSTQSAKPMFHITFNVIVSGNSWDWDDSSELYIYFHAPELGGGNEFFPWTTQSRYTGNEDFYAVKGVLQMPFHVVQESKFIYYKYAVKQSQRKGIEFEHIWNIGTSKKWNGCRCLTIPHAEKKPEGLWRQWDTIVFPKTATNPSGLQHSQEKIVAKCLDIYLNRYKKILQDCNIIPATIGISQFAYNIEQIFNQLQYRFLCFYTSVHKMRHTKEDWSSDELIWVMKHWTMSIVHNLQAKLDNCTYKRCVDGSFLVSAITVLCIVDRIIHFDKLSEQACVGLAIMLREFYRPRQRTCPAYAVLKYHIDMTQESESRFEIAKPLKHLALSILHKSSGKDWRWLLLVPLYHFLDGYSFPYQLIPLDKHIKWRFWRELKELRNYQVSKSYLDVLMNVTDLMELDCVFIQVILYICPHKNLADVLQRVDLILATSFYNWYVENERPAYYEVLDQHLKALRIAHVKLPDEDWKNQEKCSILGRNAFTLMRSILATLSRASKSQCQILHHIIHYVLFVLSEKIKRQDSDECINENDSPAIAVELIDHWLQKVIGHEAFGGAHQSEKISDEVCLWTVLLKCKEPHCSESIWEHWSIAIEQLLDKRVKLVQCRAKLASRLGSNRNTPHQVCEVIIQLTTEDLFIYYDFDDVEISDACNLFSRTLTMHLEEITSNQILLETLEKSITVEELINWKVWPSILKVSSYKWSGLFCSMSELAKQACKIAHTTLKVHCDKIVAGVVTMNDMKILKRNEKFDQLCTAACIKEFSLQKWLGRLKAIERYIERVQQFHNLLDPVVKGYKTLEEELQHVLIKSMNKLYFHWNDSHDCDLGFTCCPTIKPCTLSILDLFYHLATGRSKIFRQIWKDKLSLLISHHRRALITQENIVDFVWNPTFEYCQKLITRLKSGVIPLSEIEKVFCDDETLTDVQLSCESLLKSLVSSKMISFETEWIETVCKQIEHYRLCLKCKECAQVVLTLCDEDHLNLTGDFNSIHVLIKKYSSELAELNLCDIDVADSFVRDIQVLSIISDSTEVQCLKSLINCWQLVEWIKKFQSVNGFYAFIEVSHDATDADLLSDLRTVGNAISKYLLHLPEPCGLTDLVTACDSLYREESFHHKLLQSQQRLVSLKQCGQLLETAVIQEIDSLSRMLDHKRYQTVRMKQEIDSLSTTLSQERHQLATVKQEKFNLETISMEQSKQLDIALSKLNDREQQHAMLKESFHQATEIGRANETIIEELEEELSTANAETEYYKESYYAEKREKEQTAEELETLRLESTETINRQSADLEASHRSLEAMIEKLEKELTTANNETQYYKENYYAEKRDKEQTVEELETLRLKSTEMINRQSADLETSHRSLEAKSTELNDLEEQLNDLEEQFDFVSQTLSRLRKVDNIEGLHKAKKMGHGCFGAVYEVRVNSVPCIAKRVHDILVGREGQESVGAEQRAGAITEFQKECDLLSTLHHPNVVQFMGVHYGQDEADTSLIMEHLHMDLEYCMKTYSDIPLPYKTSILRDVAYGLAYLHSIPIIHRDLNTGNILLTESLRAKVADLGLSKLFDQNVPSGKLTMGPGAPDFMPPESIGVSPKYDVKLDIFSFGHLTIYLVNQEYPFLADKNITQEDVANKQVQVGKRRESLDRMGGTHPLYSTAVHCLSDVPDRRPTSTALVEMLEDTCEQYPVAHKNLLDALASATKERQETNETNLQDACQGVQQRKSQLSRRNTQERRPRIS